MNRFLVLVCSIVASICLPVHAQQLSLDEVLAEEKALVAGQGVRAQLIAVQTAVLSAGIAGQIKSVSASVGGYIEQGEVLVEFDCEPLLAQQKIYTSQKRVAEINLEVNQRLLELNNVGAQELALTRAEYDSALAQLEVVELQVQQCKVVAPFSGRVVARNADAYETVSAGTELIEILAQDDLEVLLVAPSTWLSWLSLEETFDLTVEEIAAKFSGRVVRIGGQVDPISQTVLVWGRLTDSPDTLLPGMSGNIDFHELR